MTNKEIKTLKQEKDLLFDEVKIEEKHNFFVKMEQPYKDNTKKNSIFMDLVRKIQFVEFNIWEHTFEIEIRHLRTKREVQLFIFYELNAVFKATEKAYNELYG